MSIILTGRGKVIPESVSLYVCGLLGCPYSQVKEEKDILKVPPYLWYLWMFMFSSERGKGCPESVVHHYMSVLWLDVNLLK